MRDKKRGLAYSRVAIVVAFVLLLSVFVSAINVELLTPADGTNTTNSSVNFTANITWMQNYNDSLTNVTLFYGTSSSWSRGPGNSSAVENNSIATFNLNLTDGVYNWTVALEFNNSDVILNGTNFTVTVDTANPSVMEFLVNTSYSDGPTKNLSGISDLNATITDLALASAQVRYENGTSQSAWLTLSRIGSTAFYVRSLDTTELADGSYNFSVNATDYVGHQNVTTFTGYVVDNTNASASIISPSNESNLGGTISINISVNDTTSGVQIVRVGYETSGVAREEQAATNTGSGFWQLSLDTSSLADGNYNLSLNVTDWAGNNLLVYNVTNVNISNEVPNASLIHPLSGNFTGTLTFNASVNTSTAALSSVQFGYSQNDVATVWIDASHGTELWNASLDTTTVAEGIYNISINATTIHGVSNTSYNQSSILIDGVGPVTTLNLPSTGTKSGNISINLSASDLGSGLSGGLANLTWRYETSSTNGTWTQLTNITTLSNSGTTYNGTFVTTAVSDGTYTIRINATDFLGNQNTTTTVQVTIDNVADSSGDEDSGSSSGGGGGGGIAVVKPGSAAAQVARVWASLTPEAKHEFKLLRKEISVQALEFAINKKAKNAQISVTALTEKPNGKVPPGKAKVHQYIEIDHTNIADEDFESVVITFTIPREWLRDNRVEQNKVRLYRFNEDTESWQALVTTLQEAGVENLTYEAISPGLSLFAVGGETTDEVVAAPTEEPTLQPTEQPTEPTAKPEPTLDDTSSNTLFTLGIVVILIVILAAGGYYLKVRNQPGFFDEEVKPAKKKSRKK